MINSCYTYEEAMAIKKSLEEAVATEDSLVPGSWLYAQLAAAKAARPDSWLYAQWVAATKVAKTQADNKVENPEPQIIRFGAIGRKLDT